MPIQSAPSRARSTAVTDGRKTWLSSSFAGSSGSHSETSSLKASPEYSHHSFVSGR